MINMGVLVTNQSVLAQTLPSVLIRNVPINWYVNATMHFLKGLVGKNGVEYVANWAKKYNKYAPT
jgi:hypothetical protein